MDCQNIAIEEGHQQLDGEHLHLALVMQQDGLIPKLLKFMEINVGAVIGDLQQEMEKLPKVTGGADNMYSSRRLSQLLMKAEKIAADFKDEYVSVEHMYLALLEEKGYTVGNVDVTIICQRPKLKDYIEQMRENVARHLKVDIDCVNIKATTTEKLGFEGEGLGISSHAVACIEKA